MAFFSFQHANGIPKLMSFAKGGNVKFLQVFELQVEKDRSIDVVDVEAFDDRRIKFRGIHPIDDVLRGPRSDPGVRIILRVSQGRIQ